MPHFTTSLKGTTELKSGDAVIEPEAAVVTSLLELTRVAR